MEKLTKICGKCKIEKPINEFGKCSRDGFQSRCKECKKADNLENKHKIFEYNQAYMAKNKEKLAKSKSEYYQKNKERLSEYKKEYRKNNMHIIKAYCQSEKGKARDKNSNHRRRVKIKNSDVTNKQLLELEKNAKVCYWCNTTLKNKKVHIDHYQPLSKDGQHTLSNLVVSCSKCNLSKNAKDPIEFANSIGKLL